MDHKLIDAGPQLVQLPTPAPHPLELLIRQPRRADKDLATLDQKLYRAGDATFSLLCSHPI
ncbi:MAG: hypothetical protein ACOYN0_04630 [Phycisphaerales bacterium]